MKITKLIAIILVLTSIAFAQDRQQFIRTDAPLIALTNIRVIDGNGTAPIENQTVVISGGKIVSVGATASTAVPNGSKVLDLAGYTVMPVWSGCTTISSSRWAATRRSIQRWGPVFQGSISRWA
jgi:hypothetical protein